MLIMKDAANYEHVRTKPERNSLEAMYMFGQASESCLVPEHLMTKSHEPFEYE